MRGDLDCSDMDENYLWGWKVLKGTLASVVGVAAALVLGFRFI